MPSSSACANCARCASARSLRSACTRATSLFSPTDAAAAPDEEEEGSVSFTRFSSLPADSFGYTIHSSLREKGKRSLSFLFLG